MTKDEALRLALRAMESFQNGTNGLYEGEFEEEITAIKAALEAKDEPVAWLCCVQGQDAVLLFDEPSDEQYPPKCKEPLYTTPPQRTWIGLTDEEKQEIYKQADEENWHDQPLLETVEAKLKEKNT
jgi:hypothetical protein